MYLVVVEHIFKLKAKIWFTIAYDELPVCNISFKVSNSIKKLKLLKMILLYGFYVNQSILKICQSSSLLQDPTEYQLKRPIIL